MSIKAEIDIDFKRAMEHADELDELSGRICNICRIKMDDAFSQITRSWKGQNYNDFMKKTGSLKDRVFETAEVLKCTADLIRNTAQLIYAAEMAAVSICC